MGRPVDAWNATSSPGHRPPKRLRRSAPATATTDDEDDNDNEQGEEEEEDEEDEQPCPSRPRRVKALRKRSVTACNFCRVRKAKCDNTRPTCSFCTRHGVTCVYAGDNTDQKHLLDPGSLEIISRLDELKEMLSTSAVRLETLLPGLRPPSQPPLQDPVVTPVTAVTEAASPSIADTPTVPASASFYLTSGEAMLRWPIFNDSLPAEDAAIQSFLLDSSIDLDTGPASASPLHHRSPEGRSDDRPPLRHPVRVGAVRIRDDEHVRLCSRYLKYVHPRNPVLDEAELMACAKETAEYGLGWDAQSCLVLLACALALLTSPWQPIDDLPVSPQSIGVPVEEDIEAAEAYFLAAKKRFGLLQTSVMDMQCLFLAVTYERFCLRPLRAWHFLEQACSRLQSHLSRKRSRRNGAGVYEDDDVQLLEHRLFWSCVKAESEFMFELPLRPTGIIDFPYPVAFPSPPEVSGHGGRPAGARDSGSTHDQLAAREKERSWFFYLAEISVRRTMMDTVETLYHGGERAWTSNLPGLLRKHDECQEKISIWHAHLPEPVKFDYSKPPDNELSFYLKGRFQFWQVIVSRPLLYHVIHRRRGRTPKEDGAIAAVEQADDEFLARARLIAQHCVSTSTNLILESSHPHRHGGTWMVCRLVFALSMTILASALSAGEVELAPNWPLAVKVAHDILLRWGSEAADIEWMRTTLLRLFNAVCDQVGPELRDDFWNA